ncbi:cytochrome P450 [Streptomyces humidus]|uniref:Cytochrome P450 n=1 Tax=Streptomyces humidus TaxID=52259 RepID=A0A918G3R9_9ACTN|nr:cytochrome P450 [Streptomyces humidus]
MLTDPHAVYAHMREQAAACPMRSLDGSLMWVVGRHEGVRSVLADPRFANDPASAGAPLMQVDAMRNLGLAEELIPYLADTLLDNDGAVHSRLRRLVAPAFSARRLLALRPRIERLTDDLLDEMAAHAEDGVVDFLGRFAYPLPITVICELVGVPMSDRPAWLRWTHALSFEQEKLGETLGPLVDHTRALVESRRARPADDLISELIRAQDGDRLTDRELVTMVLSLVIAGHDTTANFLANSVWALLTHPEQLALLRADPELTPQAVHELLRWCGPVLVSRLRYVTEDADVGWASFQAGDAVMAALSGANHDPREFPDPERLDITRRHRTRGEAHVSFGAGPHYCLGAGLARHQSEIALRRLLARWPSLSMAVSPEELNWQPVSGMRKLERLPLRLDGARPAGPPLHRDRPGPDGASA